MPFDKPTTLHSEGGGTRTLLLTAFLLSVALLCGALGAHFTVTEESTALGAVMESEAVHAFLHTGDA